MTVKDCQDGKMITLSNAFDSRPKILNFIYAYVFICSALFLLYIAISTVTGSSDFLLVTFFGIAVCLFAGYRFLNKALQTEKLLVNKTKLTITKSGFLSHQSNSYDISLISNFRHLDKPSTTRHPLAGESFDYLGFQTEQEVINEMHGDNRLAFDYNGTTIKLGENIYSWDFDQLEVILYDITGNDFRYTDDFEKHFESTGQSQQ
ncbi:MAG TPA: hypothetical protein VLC98_14835 [Phnomibacter sp.]|nr:hypothetical protein [Phnomibacter sp.]